MNATDPGLLARPGVALGSDPRPSLAGRMGVLRTVAVLNLGLRVCVELATFVSLGRWGASVDGPVAVRTLLAVAAPLVGMAAWSRWLAPRATRRLTGPAALVAELSLFASATAALIASGSGLVGLVYASLAVVNSLLTGWLRQYAPAPGSAGTGDRP